MLKECQFFGGKSSAIQMFGKAWLKEWFVFKNKFDIGN